MLKLSVSTIEIDLSRFKLSAHSKEKIAFYFVLLSTIIISLYSYFHFYQNGLGLAYNDARSHLDIARRVVEGLKPGFAQLGSVWLPLPHILMLPFVWNDFLWHSGLAGAIPSMIAFVGTGLLIYKFLEKLKVGIFGRLVGVAVFAANLNILYLQSTAMTELVLLSTMTAAVYYLLRWSQNWQMVDLIFSAFFTFLASLVRYDGWFLLAFGALVTAVLAAKKWGRSSILGMVIFFSTLGGFGVFLWLVWNQLIFGDALYFAFGPYSARAQQSQLEAAGVLATRGNILLSAKVYFYALVYNSGALSLALGIAGATLLWMSNKISASVKIAAAALFTPLFFNILALYVGHSVLFVQGISGDTWFNVRYGAMMMPSIAIFIGYLVHQLKDSRYVIILLLMLVTFFSFSTSDAVTIDDARVGSSQKNVSEVSGWLNQNAKDKAGFVLISAASHDAIIFSSGMPMKRFIHEGTGAYWTKATGEPEHWARWIVVRTYDDNDQTWKLIKNTPGFTKYDLVNHYPFADIYQLRDEYLKDLITQPVLGKQK